MNDIFDRIFRQYPNTLSGFYPEEAAKIMFFSNVSLSLLLLVLGSSVFYITRKTKNAPGAAITSLFSIFIMCIGIIFALRAVQLYYNYAVLFTLFSACVVVLGVYILLFVGKAIKKRIQYDEVHTAAIKESLLAKEAAEKAEQKADRLMELINKHNISIPNDNN